MLNQQGSAEVVAASYRLESLQAVADELLPTLAVATQANLLFLHHGSACGSAKTAIWPPGQDVLTRYQQDYAVDCPFTPVKLASREWVLPITRRLAPKKLAKTAFYADLLHPAELEHHVEVRLQPPGDDGLGPQAGIIICRGGRASEFTDSDLRMLAGLRPSLSQAFRRAQALEHAHHRIDALEGMLALGDPKSIRLAVDADGRELHLHGPTTKLDASVMATLRDPSHPLRQLAREVASGAKVPSHASATQKRVEGRDGSSFVAEVTFVSSLGTQPLAILTLTPEPLAMAHVAWGLSRTEAVVLRELVAGGSNDDIGRAMSISPETVRTHLTRIYRKMGVRSRLAAAALARSR